MTPTSLARALRKWWWALIGLTIVGALLGGVVSLVMPPRYEAKSQIFVAFDAPEGAGSSDLVQANSFAVQKVYSYAQVVISPRVLQQVIDRLDLDTTVDLLMLDVVVEVPLNSAVMTVTASAPNPDDAAVLNSTIVGVFTETVLALETPSDGAAPPIRVQSLQDAVAPETPASPNVLINLILGAGVGFIAGIIWIAVAATRDRRVYNSADVVAESGLRSVGGIPRSAGSLSPTVMFDRPMSAAAEAYRTVAATLSRSFGPDMRVVAIAGATPRDASSLVTLNLAVAMRELGVNVAVIDANLRSGAVSSSLGIPGPGLSECLDGNATASDCISVHNGIAVLPAGTTTNNPAGLISNRKFDAVVKSMSSLFDLVLIDSAPVLPLSDTLFAAEHADGSLLVVRAGASTAAQIAAAGDALAGVGSPAAGVVVLEVPRHGADSDATTSTYRDLRPSRV